jgi:hypothetical protein
LEFRATEALEGGFGDVARFFTPILEDSGPQVARLHKPNARLALILRLDPVAIAKEHAKVM